MRFLAGVLLIFLCSLGTANTKTKTAEEAPAAITIGLIPGGSPEKLRDQAVALAKEIQGEINVPVNVFLPKDYNGLIDALVEKKVDFAFFSSLTFVAAEQRTPVKVLLKKVWKEPFYFSFIITLNNSSIRKLQDLKGKRVAFVDNKSSSGYLYPMVALKKAGLKQTDFKEVIFSGNHEASIKLLEEKKVDAVAVYSDDITGKTGAWVEFGKKGMKVRSLWKSDPIPNDPFCVREDFYQAFPKTTHDLMFAFIDAAEKSKGKYTEVLGARDLMPATSKQYDPVREMQKAMGPEISL